MELLLKHIKTIKNSLRKKVEKNGLYENFGQKEIQKLEDKFINISDYSNEMNSKRALINNFNNWCMTFEG